MMRSALSKTILFMPLKPEFTRKLISGLIVAQAIMVCYLLAQDGKVTFLFAVLFGMPVALLFKSILNQGSTHNYTQMAIVMFSVGGFGMMLGCSADLGHTGLLGLLSMCRSVPLSLLPDPGQVWQKMQLTPWTYVGMFVGSNLAMLLIKELRPGASLGLVKSIYLYIICNFGMLAGLLVEEAIAIQLVINSNQFFAAGFMMGLMLLGMTLGMVVILAIVEHWNKRAVMAW